MCLTKNELRTEIKRIRTETDRSVLDEADKAIFEKVISSEEYKNCKSLLVYVSSTIEVDTRLITSHALTNGKTVLAPRVVKGTRSMDFCRISSFDDLESGYFGIYEPKIGCPVTSCFDNNDLCLVPALAYDSDGYRLGYGKGFYDVFLKRFTGIKMGLCYSSCIRQTVFRDSFDVPVDILITDKNKTIFDRM